jgi:hypothetical protein
MRVTGITVTALLASSTLSLAAHAGVYLESTDKSLGSTADKPSVSKMWFDGGRMRTERSEADGDGQIVVFKNQAMYMLEPKSKSYRVIDKATAERMGSQVAEAKKKMEERMAAMPPEQRQKMQEMMAKMGAKGGAMAGLAGAKPPERTVKNSGRTETVAGIKCTIWEAVVNGQKEEELCAAPASAIPGGDEIMKTFREISTMLSSFTESFGASGANQPWHDMEKINGVPILTRDFSDGKAESEMRLTSVRKESVPGASFDVPAGYTEKKVSFGPGAPQ